MADAHTVPIPCQKRWFRPQKELRRLQQSCADRINQRIFQMGVFDKERKQSSRNEEGQLILSEESPWPVQEAYKALRTNIIFSLPGQTCKVIGVTSAEQHDGKSVNAINTAIAFGEIEKKVMLIECDMRLPTIGAKLSVKSVPGLADLLVGQSTLKEVFHRNVRHNVDLIGAGTIPPDPTWLLQSEQMDALINSLKTHYDYIIIDLPPVTTVADAMIISKYTDGFLLVVRDKETDTGAVAESLDQMRFAKAKILGFVYNDVKETGGHYYRSGYYYKR